jgi:L-asparaginase/Glu-tRNA(Gln) amidotransferase subunit D
MSDGSKIVLNGNGSGSGNGTNGNLDLYAGNSNGNINLYNAVALAADDQASNKGVLVVMADKVFAARDVAKINART